MAVNDMQMACFRCHRSIPLRSDNDASRIEVVRNREPFDCPVQCILPTLQPFTRVSKRNERSFR